jgi:Phosphotransferase enzyme family
MTVDIIQQIKDVYSRETTERPLARLASDIPSSYESITTEWLSAILCKDTPDAKVTDFTLGAVDDGTSNRRHVRIQYNSAGKAVGLPPSIFCKAAQGLVNRLILSNGGTLSEITFYNLIREKLDIDAPRALHAAYDSESLASIIVLNDLSTEVQFCSERTIVTKEMAQSQLSLLGKLHGTFYQSPRFEDDLSQVLTWQGRFRSLIARHSMEETCRNGFAAAEAVIPPRLFAKADEVWNATLKSIDRHDELPVTLNHGDVHLKNWYIRERPVMGLSDWQALNRGHWSRDLAYAVVTSLSTEDRRNWEEELIRFYLDCQRAAGAPSVSFDVAWLNYRQQLFGALAFWTQTLAPTKNMPEMQPKETTLPFIRRLTHAIDDLDSLSAFE